MKSTKRNQTDVEKSTEGTSRRMLIPCRACGREISRKAKACPHCGHSKKRWLRTIIILLAILFLVFHEEIHDKLNIPNPVDFIAHRLLRIGGQ